jgi:hypothetical protein
MAAQHAATASIKKPIHNVKERRQIRHPLPFDNGKFCLHLWKFKKWWSLTGSNR